MDSNIHASLTDLGYANVTSIISVQDVVENVSSGHFVSLVRWLSHELADVEELEERIHSQIEDINSFNMELSVFLKELGCPFTNLTSGETQDRLASAENRYQLLDYLCSELQAARLNYLGEKSSNSDQDMEICESDIASALKKMLMVLDFPKPPDSITEQQLFSKVAIKVEENIKECPALLGKPLLNGILGEKQWNSVQKVNDTMNDQYSMRAETLLKRLDVTIQSFTWSERVKKMEKELVAIYNPRRMKMQDDMRISVVDLLAARNDLSVIEKTSNGNVRKNTQSKINKVLMQGRVPDRGGRPTEIEAPPPEMPSWQKDRTPSAPRGANRANRGRGGGNFGGGYQQSYQSNAPQTFGGGYQQQGYARGNQHNYHQAPVYQQGGGGFQQYQQYQQQSYGGNEIQGEYSNDNFEQRGRGRGRGRGRYMQ